MVVGRSKVRGRTGGLGDAIEARAEFATAFFARRAGRAARPSDGLRWAMVAAAWDARWKRTGRLTNSNGDVGGSFAA